MISCFKYIYNKNSSFNPQDPNNNSISISNINSNSKYFESIGEHYKTQCLINYSLIKSNNTNNLNQTNSMDAVYILEKEFEVYGKVNNFREMILNIKIVNQLFEYLLYLESEKKLLSNSYNLDKLIFNEAIENINILLEKKHFKYNDYLIYLSELMLQIKKTEAKNNSDTKILSHLIKLIINEMYIK